MCVNLCLVTSQSALSAMTSRLIDFTGKFEPVQHECRAPLPGGKLCPRRDRYKVSQACAVVERSLRMSSVFDLSLKFHYTKRNALLSWSILRSRMRVSYSVRFTARLYHVTRWEIPSTQTTGRDWRKSRRARKVRPNIEHSTCGTSLQTSSALIKIDVMFWVCLGFG